MLDSDEVRESFEPHIYESSGSSCTILCSWRDMYGKETEVEGGRYVGKQRGKRNHHLLFDRDVFKRTGKVEAFGSGVVDDEKLRSRNDSRQCETYEYQLCGSGVCCESYTYPSSARAQPKGVESVNHPCESEEKARKRCLLDTATAHLSFTNGRKFATRISKT